MKGKKFLAGILTAVLLLGVLPAGAAAADPYPDVLSTLTAGEKEALFEEFLYPFAGHDLDYRTASDAQVIQLLNEVWYDPDKVFAPLQELFSIRLPNGDVGIPRENLAPFTRQYFGRELDLTGLARDTLPSTEDYDNYCYYYQDALCFHAFFGMGSYPGTIFVTPQHLYDLGNGLYAATYEETWWFDIDNEITDQFLYSFVCRENADGSYRLIRGYREGYVPSTAELAAFTQPSSWAQSEVAAAEAAGLVPDLSGSPTWQDGATRLQFAQLAVQLTETATGQTIPAAPADTFSDCQDEAVRKAYQAGIVNGTTPTTFHPDRTLTREQLATMLWRAVEYIQAETGTQTLPGGGDLSGFADSAQVSDYAKAAVASLTHHNILQGTSPDKLSPKGTCTVEQSVLLCYRTFEKL